VPPLERLLEIMTRLRDPERGCPWDREQTFATIAPYTIEEAYEVADAIDREDYASLRDELGDLLLQVVYHAQMADERRLFDFAAVAEAICAKMVRRHPHVFGDAVVADAAAQTEAWERMKSEERLAAASSDAPSSVLDGIARGLPVLLRALKLQRRAAAQGFDWPDATAALAKFEEEAAELGHEIAAGADRERLADELGDLLFTCVNVARKLGLDPEAALRRANAKFERRFRRIEAMLVAERGEPLTGASLDRLDILWNRAKAEEGRGAGGRPPPPLPQPGSKTLR
jgi:MazG family protein